jgi:hypothetical protein
MNELATNGPLSFLGRYERSYFHRPTPPPLTDEMRRRARKAYEADHLACILENITEAQEAVRETTRIKYEAEGDGLFDVDSMKAKCSTRRDRERWAAVAQTVIGDYDRACAELLHWTHIKNTPHLLNAGRVPRSLKQLADDKSVPAHWSDNSEAAE